MSKSYLPYDPNQQLLLPQALQEWLPEGHLAYFISDVVDQLDLSEITERYAGVGIGYEVGYRHAHSRVSCRRAGVEATGRAEFTTGLTPGMLCKRATDLTGSGSSRWLWSGQQRRSAHEYTLPSHRVDPV